MDLIPEDATLSERAVLAETLRRLLRKTNQLGQVPHSVIKATIYEASELANFPQQVSPKRPHQAR